MSPCDIAKKIRWPAGGAPARHSTNPNLLVDGVPFALPAAYSKIRRNGYQTSES